MGLLFCAVVFALTVPAANAVGMFAATHTGGGTQADADTAPPSTPAAGTDERREAPHFDRMGGE